MPPRSHSFHRLNRSTRDQESIVEVIYGRADMPRKKVQWATNQRSLTSILHCNWEVLFTRR